MATVTIKYRDGKPPVDNAFEIFSEFDYENSASDQEALKGTYYDTNSEDKGYGDAMSDIINSMVAHPGIVAAILQAQKNGSYTYALSEQERLYFNEFKKALDAAEVTIQDYNTEGGISFGGKEYSNISDAIADGLKDSDKIEITLTDDCTTSGTKLDKAGTELILDLNGHELLCQPPMVGSGSKWLTQAFHFEKDTTVTIKNGVIRADMFPDNRMIIQNYANLTLDNVQIYGTPLTTYCVSNNYGKCVMKNHTSITTVSDDSVAFDVYYGLLPAYYDKGVTVEIADDTVQINGRYEYGKAGKAPQDGFEEKTFLYKPQGYELPALDGYTWGVVPDGKNRLVKAE